MSAPGAFIYIDNFFKFPHTQKQTQDIMFTLQTLKNALRLQSEHYILRLFRPSYTNYRFSRTYAISSSHIGLIPSLCLLIYPKWITSSVLSIGKYRTLGFTVSCSSGIQPR